MSIYRRDTKYKPRWKDIYDVPPALPSISKGYMTMSVPISVFIENRQRLVNKLKSEAPHGLILLNSANPSRCRLTQAYSQDPFFFWAFGHEEPGGIGAIDVGNDKSYIIVERLNKASQEWHGKGPKTRKEFKSRLVVNSVWYTDELKIFLDFMYSHNDCKQILILADEEKEMLPLIYPYLYNCSKLYPAISYLMVRKTDNEIKILSYVAQVLESSLIHIMKRLRPGMSDKQVEAWFDFFIKYKSNFEKKSFSMLTGSESTDLSPAGKLLSSHCKVRTFEEGDLCVVDLGAAYLGYNVSLGAVLPVSESFSDPQLLVYQAVLKMRNHLQHQLKAGTPLSNVQNAAETYLLDILNKDLCVLFGTVEGAKKAGVGRLLIPHRVVSPVDFGCVDADELELGRVYLIEPGCHFDERVLGEAFIKEPLRKYLRNEIHQFDGLLVKVRDPVLITTYGFKYLSDVTREVNIIEELRSKDPHVRNTSVMEMKEQNLRVSPSLFSVGRNF